MRTKHDIKVRLVTEDPKVLGDAEIGNVLHFPVR
jgi:hypothetical protein